MFMCILSRISSKIVIICCKVLYLACCYILEARSTRELERIIKQINESGP